MTNPAEQAKKISKIDRTVMGGGALTLGLAMPFAFVAGFPVLATTASVVAASLAVVGASMTVIGGYQALVAKEKSGLAQTMVEDIGNSLAEQNTPNRKNIKSSAQGMQKEVEAHSSGTHQHAKRAVWALLGGAVVCSFAPAGAVFCWAYMAHQLNKSLQEKEKTDFAFVSLASLREQLKESAPSAHTPMGAPARKLGL